MDDRELKSVTLPSGKVAKIVTFFTRGEKKDISNKKWGNAKAVQAEDTTIQIVDIPMNQGVLEEDAVVLNGTKFVSDVEFTETGMNSLDSDDFDILLAALKPVFVGKKKKN